MIPFKQFVEISEALQWHVDNSVPLSENVFRVGSKSYFDLYREARELQESGSMDFDGWDGYLLKETDIGKFDFLDGQPVPLDCPMFEEDEKEKVELGKPKRGGPKKFYVFVKDPSTGNVKKVTWGDTTGLTIKMNDPEARKSFAARHQCSTQKDRTSAAYWACNTPRYAKQLGLSGGGNFYW